MKNNRIEATKRRLSNAWAFIIKSKVSPEISDAIAEIVECELLLEAESNK